MQYIDGLTREGASLDLLFRNEAGQVAEVSVGKYFWTNYIFIK